MQKVFKSIATVASGDPRDRLRAFALTFGVPVVAIALFLWVWALISPSG